MKIITTTALALTLMGGAAHAQLGSVTGQVNNGLSGTLNGSVNGIGNVGSDITSDTKAAVDSRSGAMVDSELTADLGASLNTNEIEQAGMKLKNQLENDAKMLKAKSEAAAEATYDRGTTTATHIRNKAETTPMPVTVYTSDGFKVGTVDSMSGNAIMITTKTGASAETMTVSDGEAKFNADANAVVLDMAKADLSASASAGY